MRMETRQRYVPGVVDCSVRLDAKGRASGHSGCLGGGVRLAVVAPEIGAGHIGDLGSMARTFSRRYLQIENKMMSYWGLGVIVVRLANVLPVCRDGAAEDKRRECVCCAVRDMSTP